MLNVLVVSILVLFIVMLYRQTGEHDAVKLVFNTLCSIENKQTSRRAK